MLINGVVAPAVVVESDNVVSAITPPLPEGSALNVQLILDVATTFPVAAGKRVSARLDSLNAAPIVVEQSIYWSLGTGAWVTGVSLPATRLR